MSRNTEAKSKVDDRSEVTRVYGEWIHDWDDRGPVELTASAPQVVDESLRDGLQSPSATDPCLGDKLEMLRRMDAIGIEAADIGLPGAHPRQFDHALALVREIAQERLAISPHCAARTRISDIERVVEISQRAGVSLEVSVFVGSSPIRARVEGWTLDMLRRRTEESISFALRHGLSVMYVTEDTTRSTPDTLRELYTTALRCGASRLCIADTVGCATPAAASALVRFVRSLINETGASGVSVDWHGHRDRGLDVASAMAAWEAGAQRCHGTVLGIGERCGNAPIELLLLNLHLRGYKKYALPLLTGYVEFAARALGVPVPCGQPLVGADAFRTATGTHAAAVAKALRQGDSWLAELVYSCLPASELGRTQSIEVGPLSGEANVKYYLDRKGITAGDDVVREVVVRAKARGRLLLGSEIDAIVSAGNREDARSERPPLATRGTVRSEKRLRIPMPLVPAPTPIRPTVSDAIVRILEDLGVRHGFGLVGGTIAPFCEALVRSSIQVIHARHESGAAFAAAEASIATGRPAAVFTTSGPGLVNALNGMMSARGEGARVVLVSGTTALADRGRWAFQETSPTTMPSSLFRGGKVFHYATELQELDTLHDIAEALRAGFLRPQGFVAHVALPSSVQTQLVSSRIGPVTRPPKRGLDPVAAAPQICRYEPLDGERWAKLISKRPLLVWVGFGARREPEAVRELVERTDARVICSPRGKGIFPEDHPSFVGVTGFAGRADLAEAIRQDPPTTLLVLGSRLGEFTSFWSADLLPPSGIVHVDVDATVPGAAFPGVPTRPIHAEIGAFLRAVLPNLPSGAQGQARVVVAPDNAAAAPDLGNDTKVSPRALMAALQREVVDATEAPLLADIGNAFAWATHLLCFRAPGRFRTSMGWGSMGQASAGVVGVALATTRKAVALVGDGALLMQNEISTAVQYGAKAVWVVLNDSQYGMIEHCMRAQSMRPAETQIPRVDFVGIARSLGADGVTVNCAADLQASLRQAMKADGPFVVDVMVDRQDAPPVGDRVRHLVEQGAEGNFDGRQY